MLIRNGDKSLSFTVERYEYPDCKSSNTSNEYDANWLMLKVTWSDDNGKQIYQGACLLAWELQEIPKELGRIIAGDELLYLSDFMEPYLKLVFANADQQILTGIEFVYDTTDGVWKSHKLVETMSIKDAKKLVEELNTLCEKYHVR